MYATATYSLSEDFKFKLTIIICTELEVENILFYLVICKTVLCAIFTHTTCFYDCSSGSGGTSPTRTVHPVLVSEENVNPANYVAPRLLKKNKHKVPFKLLICNEMLSVYLHTNSH